MTSEEESVALRIEVRRSGTWISVVVVDPATEQELPLVEDLDAVVLADVNRFLWSKLDRLSSEVSYDPQIPKTKRGDLAFQIFGAGQVALLRLAGEGNEERLEEVKRFCAARLDPDTSECQIIQIVTTPRDHLPFEIMPLLGDLSDPTMEGVDSLAELKGVMPGLVAICRHVPPERRSATVTLPRHLGIRLFRNNRLPGVTFERRFLEDLQKQRRAWLCGVFPPKGYTPEPHFPELSLTREVTKTWTTLRLPNEGTDVAVSHFSCHIVRAGEDVRLVLRPDGFRPNDIPYALDQIEVAAGYVDKSSPPLLIFLGACQSAAVNQQNYTSAVKAFERLKPSSIVGALASIPDLLAAEFTKVFYESMSNGATVGASLLASKGAMLGAPFNNPLSLLFVSFFGEDSRIANPHPFRQRFLPPSLNTTL